MIIFALVLAVAAAAPQHGLFGGHHNRPGGLFGQPGAVAHPPGLINPLGKPPIFIIGDMNFNPTLI